MYECLNQVCYITFALVFISCCLHFFTFKYVTYMFLLAISIYKIAYSERGHVVIQS